MKIGSRWSGGMALAAFVACVGVGVGVGPGVGIGMGTGMAAGAPGGAPDPDARFDGYERFVRPDGSFDFDPETAMDGLVHLGSWFVPRGDAAGFHHVYTQPGVAEAWRETGRFPDGAALIKEIASHRRASYTTGANVASVTAPKQWFVMVKDVKGRFPDAATWGEGWGWALFQSESPTKNVASDFRRDCLGCHIPARSNDWVYTEGYPSLRELHSDGPRTGALDRSESTKPSDTSDPSDPSDSASPAR